MFRSCITKNLCEGFKPRKGVMIERNTIKTAPIHPLKYSSQRSDNSANAHV